MTHEDEKRIPSAFAIVGGSGSGKTTLIERLIPELAKRGFKVGAVKHDAHEFEIDHPGKDSYRHKAAGAAASLIVSATKLALVADVEGLPPVESIIYSYLAHCDIVLVEGYHLSGLPKVWVRRRGVRDDHIRPDKLLAIVADEPCHSGVPCFSHGATAGIAKLIVERMAPVHRPPQQVFRLPAPRPS